MSLCFLWTESSGDTDRQGTSGVMHPLQYELESARHTDSQRRAAQRRLVAEAEHLASGRTWPIPVLGTIVVRTRRYVSLFLGVEVLSHAES